MANVLVSEAKHYKVKPNTPVDLTVVVGYKQLGGTSLMLKNQQGDSEYPFDNQTGTARIDREGQNLDLTRLRCTTIVEDRNPATNRTSVTYTLRGGKEDKEFPYAVEVRADKGSATYTIDFVFIE
jgi:hypothetical protein